LSAPKLPTRRQSLCLIVFPSFPLRPRQTWRCRVACGRPTLSSCTARRAHGLALPRLVRGALPTPLSEQKRVFVCWALRCEQNVASRAADRKLLRAFRAIAFSIILRGCCSSARAQARRTIRDGEPRAHSPISRVYPDILAC
jgi:hypothetical protein